MNYCKNKKKACCISEKICPLVLLFIILFIVCIPVYASSDTENVEVNYFYISVCASCHDTEQYLASVADQNYSEFKEKNKKLYIYKYNTAEKENLNLLQKFYEAYHVPKTDRNLPVVFFGNSYISSDREIKLRLGKELGDAEPGSPVQKDTTIEMGGTNAVLKNFAGLKVINPFTTGFVNGLTPCSLSMLLFFISMLLARNINIMKMGLLYCAGKLLAYFLLGTLFFKVLGSINGAWLELAIKVVMLAAILVFICLNAMDFLAARKEKYEKITLQLPVKLRGLNHKLIKAVSVIDSPKSLAYFSFLLGIATSIGEFLCTGQIYLTTILYTLHSQTALNAKALLYFLEYSLAFVTPLLIITFIIYRGKGLLDVSELIRKNMHIIKLINILIFLIFGLYLIFEP